MESYSSIEQLEALSWLTERRYKRRHRRKVMVVVLSLVLALLVLTVVGLEAWRRYTEANKPFELPASVELQSLVLADNVPVRPSEFVLGLGGTGVRVSFQEEPDASVLGQQDVVLVFTGENGSCTRTASLYRFRLEPVISVVMGQDEIPDIRDFVPDTAVDAEFVGRSPAQIPEELCGIFELQISCGGREYGVSYIVTENIPPQAAAVEVTTGASVLPEPAALVTDIVDHSEVTVTYLEVPSVNMPGSYPVKLVLTDAYGNTSQVESVIHVVPAANGPSFSGLEELRIQVGDTVAYKAGVIATDPQDGELTFTVDASGVNNKVEGTYSVYYTAVDSDGLTLTVERKVVVQSVETAAVEQQALAVLEQLITPEMTLDQQIRAVYSYTRSNVQYVGSSDKTSVIHGAYEGFTTGKGDCYTYYAMNVVMLDLLGIENLEVRRTGGETNHWWSLVLHEDGLYYHVDSCPVSVKVDGIFHGKMTDSDLEAYTEAVSWRKPNYYNYDKALTEYEGIPIAP